jgi:suppressor of G2 allele of SKP1
VRVCAQWPSLEPAGAAGGVAARDSATPEPDAAVPEAAAARSVAYKRAPRDWSALEKELEAEEKATQLEGDAALNKLFRELYAGADDDTRRAMVKSYTESGGTCLSTDWRSVGAKTVPVEPPSGLVAKKYEQ